MSVFDRDVRKMTFDSCWYEKYNHTPKKHWIYWFSGSLLIIATFIHLMAEKGWPMDSSTINIGATILSSSNCRFNPPKNGLIDFGTLDPNSGSSVNSSTILTIRCSGSAPMATYGISDDDGLNETGPNGNRMVHATVPTEYIPYSLTVTPTSATVPRNMDQILTITATVNGTDYQNAVAGNYTDVVTVTVTP